jgi:hypothetical protein
MKTGVIAEAFIRAQIAKGEDPAYAFERQAKEGLIANGWEEAEAQKGAVSISRQASCSFAYNLTPEGSGKTVCFAIAFEQDAESLLRFLGPNPDKELKRAAVEFIIDHEEGHCRNAPPLRDFDLVTSWVDESRADAYATQKALRGGEVQRRVARMSEWRRLFAMFSEGLGDYWTTPVTHIAFQGNDQAVREALEAMKRRWTPEDVHVIEVGWEALKAALMNGKDGSLEQAAAWGQALVMIPEPLRSEIPLLSAFRDVGQTAWPEARDWRWPAIGRREKAAPALAQSAGATP